MSIAPHVPPPAQLTARPSSPSSSDWLGVSLLTAKTIAAAGECLSVPYVKGAFALVILILETVEKVKRNREDLKELCEDILETMEIVRDQVSAYGEMTAVRCKKLCKDLESLLKDMQSAVEHLQKDPEGFPSRLKQVLKLSSTADKIITYRRRLRTLRERFLVGTAADTNVHIHKLISMSSTSPTSGSIPEVLQSIHTCPSPSRIFQGRQPILEKMDRYFKQDLDKQHIFLLYGLGGAGKTQISLKFIELSSRFTHIFLVDASTVATIETGLQSIAGGTIQNALNWLTAKQEQWLLLFDNADDPKINLNSYFPRCNHGNIIITSRNPGLKVYAGSHTLVSDMEEAEAVKLLLLCAAQEHTSGNEQIAAHIVQELSCLPLAIIQAGAFIAESGALTSYLALFKRHRTRLLQKKPAQSHDDYAGTVYTTWQISFDRLPDAAQKLLQMCSLLHHQGIFEEIFSLASGYKCNSDGPSEQELQQARDFLALFADPAQEWDSLLFMEATMQLQAYSLINFDNQTGLFSIHPLVQSWTQSTLTSQRDCHYSMVAIVGMTIAKIPALAMEPTSRWLLPHIDSLLGSDADIKPDFTDWYALIYHYSRRPEVIDLRKLAYNKRKETLGVDHSDTLAAIHNLATAYNKLDQPKRAEELLVVLVEKYRRFLTEDHLNTVRVMAELAVAHDKLGQSHKAKELHGLVLKKYTAMLGEDHPTTLRAMGNLAFSHENIGESTRAAELQALVLEKRRRVLGEGHPATLHTMGGLAWSYQTLGHLKKALELQVVVLEKRRDAHGEDHPEIPLAMANLARTRYKLGEFTKARELQVAVLDKQIKIFGPDNLNTLWTMVSLAKTYQALSQWGKAKELQVAVIEKLQNSIGEDHPHTLFVMEDLALTYQNLGDVEKSPT
ncbi:hypothetical protein DFH06DRAFT_1101081 [Mycena polygramma]|nr:hypothetical protein DFH06DRAFT_1101081 [Mycena polygramma]